MGIQLQKQLNPFGTIADGNRYYLRSGSTQTVRMKEICMQISDYTASSSADVLSVMEAFKGVLLRNLSSGKNVELGTIGTLCPFFTSKSFSENKRFKASEIRLRRVILKLRSDYKKEIEGSLLFAERQNNQRHIPFTPEERSERILAHLSEHPFTTSLLAKDMNRCSRQTALYDLKRLQQQERIVRNRIGSGVIYTLK